MFSVAGAPLTSQYIAEEMILVLEAGEPIHVDVSFIREAAEIFARFDLPLTWHVRIGVEFPNIAAPSELAGRSQNPSKLYRKTLSVGSPREVGNNDLMSVDKATGLRIITSQAHLPFLAGQRLRSTDQSRATLLEAIRQHKMHDQTVVNVKKSSEQGVQAAPATENDERENAIRPANSDKTADSIPIEKDKKG